MAPFGIDRHLLWQWRDRRRLPTIDQASAFAAISGMNTNALFHALALTKGQMKIERRRKRGAQGSLFGLMITLLACGVSPATGCLESDCKEAFRATLSTTVADDGL